MSHPLNFAQKYKFDSLRQGITLEVSLRDGERFANVFAKIDTGAEVCLFAREVGESLGLQVDAGLPKRFSTLTGEFTAYGHELTLETLETIFFTTIYFAADDTLKRNLLGRQGWLQLVRLAIIDYDSEIYLSPYNEA